MATIQELILATEVERDQAIQRRERALAEPKAIIARAKSEGRDGLTDEEDADIKAALRRHDDAEASIKKINEKLDFLRETQEREERTDTYQADKTGAGKTADSPKPAYDRVARVGREERTYHAGNDRKGGVFIRDVARQFLYRDLDAEARLARHMQEERIERANYLSTNRAAGDAATSAFAGLTVPQYLTDMYAPATAALRPFADVCNKHDLPSDGMSVNISRITTPTSVALQAAEFDAVSGTSIDDTLLTIPVQTAAGQQTLSRQAIDRGTGVEAIVMDDLFARYATVLDSTLINQATTGLDAVSATQTYTAATPTNKLLYAQMIAAASQVEGNLLGFANPDVIVMHSRRWYSLLSAVSANWPIVNTPNSGVAQQSTATDLGRSYGAGIRGVLQNGLAVCVDNNVATNYGTATSQDRAYVVPTRECHLWEDPAAPAFIRAEQPKAANLGVLLVLYGYFAYTFARYSNGTVKIDGTGMAPPNWSGD